MCLTFGEVGIKKTESRTIEHLNFIDYTAKLVGWVARTSVGDDRVSYSSFQGLYIDLRLLVDKDRLKD